MHVFARTKFQPPRPRADLIVRERLDQSLRRALGTARLVLVSAPAGAGKTTLVATALSACTNQTIWVALDADDDELLRFLGLLVHAFTHSPLASGDTARRMLEGLGDASVADRPQLARRIMAAMINDLPDPLPAPYTLVLDDLHAVTDPAIFTALDVLLERLPAALTLVIATRHDPPLALGRLRARRELYDLRLNQLQFTLDETTALLNDQLGLGLAASEILPLHQRTEGWAAGLILLAASLEHFSAPAERARFLERLVQTDRYLFDYLAEEVLHRQEPFVRMFLLETSVLAELTPAMCQAMTGRSDAGAILDDLYRRNLFLTDIQLSAPAAVAAESPPSQNEPTYRYHDLFRAFLQARLRQEAPEWWRVLHGRAAAAEADIVRRASHLLHAEDWETIADLVEQQGEELIIHGRPGVVAAWIARMPATVLDRRPHIAYLRGVLAIEQRDLERGRALLGQALAGLAATDDARLRGAALVALASCCSMMSDFAAAQTAAEQALDLPLANATRVHLLAVRAHLAMGRGEWPQTAALLDEALALATELGDARTLGTLVGYFFVAYGVLPPDGAGRLERLCALIERLAQPYHLPLLAAGAQYRAWLLMWRGHWEAAQAEAVRALALSDQAGGLFWIELEIDILLPTLHVLLGNADAAENSLARLQEAIARPDVARSMRSWAAVYLFAQARIRWLAGRTDEAAALYQQMCAAQNESEWPGVAGLRDQMAALLLLNDPDPSAALAPAERAALLMERYRFTAQFGEARVVLAAALLRARRPAEALDTFTPVLAQAAAEALLGRVRWEGGSLIVPLLRLAVEHDQYAALATDLLAALGEPMRSATPSDGFIVPETGERLSARELEVLRLVARGASNSAIADTLVISAHTAKHHVSHVLAKLGVATRAEAATRARDFGLL